tara:strand:- start:1186 stop:1458 length:273 start_codon:yes stop_codon:yes gene_type:complete
MALSRSQVKDLLVGDLVTHVLYGKEWVGIIVGFLVASEPVHTSRNEKALVQILPGTKFEGFFAQKVSEKHRVNENLGYVTTNWLFRVREK